MQKHGKIILLMQVLLVAIIIVGVVVGVVYSIRSRKNEEQGAVASNSLECPGMAADMFKKGGSIADATVAALICEGITNPQSAGIGGGFFLTIYIKETGVVETMDAREIAPKLATTNMYEKDPSASSTGGLSIAVPGEIKGLWELHQKYGKLSWREVIQPNINLCRHGHKLPIYIARILKAREDRILNEPTLSNTFINPETNQVWKEGDLVKREELADSLEIIATEGANAIYNNGSLTNILVNAIRTFGGIITIEDFLDYRVRWGKPEITELKNEHKLYTFPLPATGSVLTFILNILDNYDLKHDALSYHRITEAFKFGYGSRTRLGDEPSDDIKELVQNLTSPEHADFIRSQIDDTRTYNEPTHYGALFESVEDHGTANLCILAPNGDAVAATTTINYVLGSFKSSAGIILNNEMDDFAVPGSKNIYGIPPSPANFIQPGKRPLSSMTPTIILNKNGDVRMIIGGAGGSRITTGTAFGIILHLFMNKTLEEALGARRLHHQINPMRLQYETGFDQNILDELENKYMHELQENTPDGGFSAQTAIAIQDGLIEAHFDKRRGGNTIVF